MPLYASRCPEHGLFEEYYKASDIQTDDEGDILVECPDCGKYFNTVISRTGILNRTVVGGLVVSGHTFENIAQAEAFAAKSGRTLVNTEGSDFRQTRDASRDGTDAWFKSQGYSDKAGFRQRLARDPNEPSERAQAARERQARTGSTDSSGANERFRALAQRGFPG